MTDGTRSSAMANLNSPPEALRTITVMENNPEIALFLRKQLQDARYNVILAESLKDCMELAAHGCRTFILDIDMGRGREDEGIAALKQLKDYERTLFCVLLAHHRDDRLRRDARDLGCDAFLSDSGHSLTSDFDQILMALDRMWLGQATDLSFDPVHRPKADEIVRRVEEIRRGHPGDASPAPQREELVSQYRTLTEKDLESGLTDDEQSELDAVTKALEKIEQTDADEVDGGTASGRVGKLDEALDRIEDILRQWKEAKS